MLINTDFDPTKPVKNWDGKAARIICTDLQTRSRYNIVAAVMVDGDETVVCVNAYGESPKPRYFKLRNQLPPPSQLGEELLDAVDYIKFVDRTCATMKSVHYAYPTSPVAVAYGRAKTGCYYVAHGDQTHGPFDNIVQAETVAASLPCSWDPLYLRHPLSGSRFAAPHSG